MTSDESISAQLGQFAPITMIEDPFAHPTVDPKDNERKAVGIPVALKHKDVEIVDLKPFFDKYRTKPEVRSGSVRLADLSSFIQFVKRYYNAETTVVFVTTAYDEGKHLFEAEAIFDYHPFGPEITKTGAGKFRAVLTESFAIADSIGAYCKNIREIPGMQEKVFFGSEQT